MSSSPAAILNVLQQVQNDLVRVVCQTCQVPPLAASQALSRLQGSIADIQGDILINASISQWPDCISHACLVSALFWRSAAGSSKNFDQRLFSAATP